MAWGLSLGLSVKSRCVVRFQAVCQARVPLHGFEISGAADTQGVICVLSTVDACPATEAQQHAVEKLFLENFQGETLIPRYQNHQALAIKFYSGAFYSK